MIIEVTLTTILVFAVVVLIRPAAHNVGDSFAEKVSGEESSHVTAKPAERADYFRY